MALGKMKGIAARDFWFPFEVAEPWFGRGDQGSNLPTASLSYQRANGRL